MAGDAKKLQPIIVKKIKKSGHAAHGGAWKIAYADFVTAMMAFFLLMWLLGSTSEGDKKGLSDYFNAPLKVSMQGGSGAGASNSILPGGGKDLTEKTGQTMRGQSDDPMKRRMAEESSKAEAARQDAQRIENLRTRIEALITNSPKLNEYRSQIQLETTPDGLQIQIVDDQNRPMFDSGSALVKPYMREILREIGAALNGVENRISLAGHTDSKPYGNGDRGYSNWELSADRANASRRELVAAGMPDEKLGRVVGLAASRLLDTQNPGAPVNRRITLTVMTREAESRLMGGATIAPIAPSPAAPVFETGPKTETLPLPGKR
ncbi:flagellar motor protein MotB [Pseudorhodoferax sp. Leaf267]|uniref:flagellar motor protein MotB n=1 Tax=Pseudorhodoferax sp. Leaf267 TaxID=1736316 RepID=UPI0006FBC24F|nr:flagellar motor protein MotB [Pseudorhodoferax sp. Leaf267]KQP13766.1 flagellar motor protein MotB [Pseudorhodoferax sp. Leaf267]